MNISGVLVRALPNRFPEVLAELRKLPGAQVHSTSTQGGHIVLTIEDGPNYRVEESLLRLQLVDGISDASLVYQYADDTVHSTGAAIFKEVKA
jgi:periplasmic nitrate reductase NapD